MKVKLFHFLDISKHTCTIECPQDHKEQADPLFNRFMAQTTFLKSVFLTFSIYLDSIID